jgi:protoheme IX farnesyltransferase
MNMSYRGDLCRYIWQSCLLKQSVSSRSFAKLATTIPRSFEAIRPFVYNKPTLYTMFPPIIYQRYGCTESCRDPTEMVPAKTLSPTSLVSIYLELSKVKLASLVVLTSMVGYAMAPSSDPVLTHLSTLIATTLGTTLCVSSANAINQWIEAPYDAQMNRTRNRVLVRYAIGPAHAWLFGMASGVTGVAVLYFLVNPLTAFLGFSNIVLYTLAYTPLKRMSIFNTWVGAVVGALPPLMGWTASTNSLSVGAALLGALLYAWQFPHFSSLSWSYRHDYSRAGYHMMAVIAPRLNSRVALRYSLWMLPLCWCISMVELTSPWFALDSSIVNLVLIESAYRFHKTCNDPTAKKLFFVSLLHLPIILTLLLIHKKQEEPSKT